MSIPDYQSLMLPLLQTIKDGKEYQYREIIELLANTFQLTHEEQKELLPSGRQEIFVNRVGWAKTYLKKAGLIEYPRRAILMISDRGKEVLSQNLNRIDAKFLTQFSEFKDFAGINTDDNNEPSSLNDNEISLEEKQTPEELLENAYQRIRESLATELLAKVRQLPPATFERLVIELLVRMGYGGSIKDAGKAIGKSGDEGIDGIIKEDKLGLDVIYIQAKRWADGNVVGRPELQKFVGALAGQGAKKGIFITTSSFTKDALEYTPKNDTKIVLINGEQIGQLMIDYNLGVSLQQVYEVKKIDGDYFEDQ